MDDDLDACLAQQEQEHQVECLIDILAMCKPCLTEEEFSLLCYSCGIDSEVV